MSSPTAAEDRAASNRSDIAIRIDAPCGPLIGRSDGQVARFLGVPFAEPPVGALRFRSPVSRKPFLEPWDASEYGATPQRLPLADTTTLPEHSIEGRDTLNLNVFAPPTRPAGLLPVMVYIHGGAYVAGVPSSDWYDGGTFVEDSVVVVTVSYRLGFEGFAFLDGDDNRAVRDWLLALQWVQTNIAAFGGDPDRVTIAGQSAGGGAVLTLLGCADAQPFFAQAVALSPLDSSVSREDAAHQIAAVADRLGVPANRDGFQSVDEVTLARIAIEAVQPHAGSELILAPTTGTALLPQPVADATAQFGLDKPLLIGATSDEFDVPRPAEVSAVPRLTDILFRRAVMQATVNRARASASTWLYTFDWVSPTLGAAAHCIDLPFFFNHLNAEGTDEVLGANPPTELASIMHADLVRFLQGAGASWTPASGALGDMSRVYGPTTQLVSGSYDDVLNQFKNLARHKDQEDLSGA